MGVSVTITGSSRDVRRSLAQIRKVDQPKATRAALNRTGPQVVSRAVKLVSQQLNVRPQKLIRARVRSTKATLARLTFHLKVFTQPIPARRLRPRQTRKGVRAGGRMYEGAFLQTVSGRLTVLRRTSKSRYPLEAPAVAIKTTAEATVERILRSEGRTIFRKEIERQIQRFLKRHQAKG